MIRAVVAALLAVLALAAPAAAAPPTVRGPSAIVVQPDTGDVVMAKAPDAERPIASTTKLMTALLTVEGANLDDVVPAAPYHPLPAESVIGLRAGERLTVRDLLRGLLLASANDAAQTLGRYVGGSERKFVARMNARARELGLRHTHFANPIGLDDPDNYSSARDLVKVALVLLRDPFVRETVDRPGATLRTGARVRRIANRNLLVRNVPEVNGVKTGHTTQAGYVLVGSAERGGVRVLSVVLGEPSEEARDDDSLALLRYGLARYRSVTAVKNGQVLATPALKYRDGDVDVIAARGAREVVRRGRRARVTVSGVPDELNGPLAARARVGTAVVRVGDRVVDRVPLVTAAPVAEASFSQRTTDFLSSGWVVALIAVLALSTLQLALMRRRASRRRDRSRRRRGTETA